MNIFKKLWIFIFCQNNGKNIGENISKSLSGKYCRKLLDHAKQSAADALKTSAKRVIQKTTEATGDFIGNKTANKITKVTIIDTILFTPVATLSTQDNAKLIEQLKSGFKRTINWNKYEPRVTVEQQSQYLYFLIYPGFQGVNRPFVLSFQNNGGRTSFTRYYLPLVEAKNYNDVIDGRNIFDQPVKII